MLQFLCIPSPPNSSENQATIVTCPLIIVYINILSKEVVSRVFTSQQTFKIKILLEEIKNIF